MNCLVNYSDSSDGDELNTDFIPKIKSGETTIAAISISVTSATEETKAETEFVSKITSNKTKNEHEFESKATTDSLISRDQIKAGVLSCKKVNEQHNNHSEAEEPGLGRLGAVDDSDSVTKSKRRKTDTGTGHALSSALSFKPSSSTYGHCEKASKDQLNLPVAIQCMFNDRQGSRQWEDDPSQHGNRARSFPHVEGNWATHVFIQVKKDERLVQFVNQLLELFGPLSFEIQPEFHISLSRTVAIRHHWIDPLVDSLKQGFSSMQSCVGDLDQIKLYSNDEGTRSFLCIEVSKDDTAFVEYVSVIDKCFKGFKLPKYYEVFTSCWVITISKSFAIVPDTSKIRSDNPSFHISVAWCLGDICDSVTEDKLSQAKKLLGRFCTANPELSVVFAQNICCRSGNKSFSIPLVV